MMLEIAVALMLIQIIATYINALKEEEGVVEELQHLRELQLFEAEIRVRLVMGIVMISTTIYTAADLMLTLNIVMNVGFQTTV